MTGSDPPQETRAATSAVMGGWSAAGAPSLNGSSKPRPSAISRAWIE
jgi:hypothetical protein